jgi:eukaryotic-like serine/threonine-protein kinase
MALTSGDRLGSYAVLSPLGAGGMGEVYRARDSKLGRDVALKVLPEAFARDAERMARFQREAKVLASLNHPNIASIYGLEDSGATHALVMELVEGPTLADRIKQGPIPIDEALRIAKQICEALEYAHERGIVHRDLKPANVKVTNDDAVKVLDFGLAKAIESDAASVDISTSPTMSRMATLAGVLLGTAAYMSPEQAKAKPADRRADIWAFGCVLYEMLTGQMAFNGETVTETLASVIRSEPDWLELPPATPVRVRVLLQRCLQKDPKQRLQAIGDARIVLEEVLSGTPDPSLGGSVQFSVPLWRRALPWVVAGLLAAALIAVVAVWKIAAHATVPEAAMHFSAVTDFPGVQAQPSLSPDGRSVAFVSNRDGHYNIYVALVNGGSLVQITNDTNLKSRPAWSPDGTTIAYARVNDSGIWNVWDVPALGGTPRRLILNAADPAWSPDSRSLAYENMADNALWISGASGENAHQVAGTAESEWFDAEPRFSPDGRKIAFAARNSDGGPYGELAVADLDSGKTRLLTHDNALALSPAWAPDGRSIYFASSRGGTVNVWKIGADGSGLQQITAGEGDDAELDVSADGKRIVFSTLREHIALAQLDLQAKLGQQSVKLLTTDTVRDQFGPVYSPDGSHLAYFSNLKGIEQEGISIADADGSNATPFVQDPRVNIFPHWTPDGKYLVYESAVTVFGKWEYRRVAVSGGVPHTLLTGDRLTRPEVGPDGRLLFPGPYGEVETFDPRDNKTETLGKLPADARWERLRWSPDGRSVALLVSPSDENDTNAGLWVDDFKNPPRQIFRGWVVWYVLGPANELYLLEGKPDLNGVLCKVGWDGQGFTRTPATIPILYNLNYKHTVFENQFDVSPDARHLAFQTEQILEENIGMIENVR